MVRLLLSPMLAALFAVLVSAPAGAQPAPMSPELRNAQTLFQAQKWTEAIAAYEAVLKTDSNDPRAHAGLAAALYSTGENHGSLAHALEADRLLEDPKLQFAFPGLPRSLVRVRIARIHNRLGKTDEAFTWLTRATQYPIPAAAALETEPDLANLRSDARWKAFTSAVQATLDPCNSTPEYRQLDYWIGDWEVKNPAGQLIGTSRIERILNNCVIQETYTGAPGSAPAAKYVGQAFHFYDQNLKKWSQHYVDTTARPFDWVGELRGGVMFYSREGPYGPSNMFIKQRMTFTPKDGGVHQLFEQSIDGGKSWRTGFTGIYVKRTEKAQ
jgi:tetratricopeptide (TPR) repeat protein